MVESVIQMKTGIVINVNASAKVIIYFKKRNIWNPSTCSRTNGKYLASIIKDEIIDAEAKSHNEETKTIPTNLN